MRDRIIEATLDCMREHGVRGATTKTVARCAGVSEGSIYNHFTNRSELVAEAFGSVTQEIRGHAGGLQRLVGVNTVQENLVTLMEAVIEFFGEIAPIAGSIIGDPDLRSWVTEGTVSSREGPPLTPLTGAIELSAYLEAECEAGRLPPRGSWSVRATMLLGACLHYVYLDLLAASGAAGVLPDGEKTAHEYAHAVVGTLFAGEDVG